LLDPPGTAAGVSAMTVMFLSYHAVRRTMIAARPH
jgi:hypothetical protein